MHLGLERERSGEKRAGAGRNLPLSLANSEYTKEKVVLALSVREVQALLYSISGYS